MTRANADHVWFAKGVLQAPQLSLSCPSLVGVVGELDGDLVALGSWAKVRWDLGAW